MASKASKAPTLATIQAQLQTAVFRVSPLRDGKVLARKDGCAAVIGAGSDGAVAICAPPGRVVAGELARLVDRGYQKFFKSAAGEVPALPEEMSALAHFEQQLRFVCGIPSLYNEGLGSVSDRYLYDRIWYRDEGRQPKPWETDAAAALAG